jgi:hypothetical protein
MEEEMGYHEQTDKDETYRGNSYLPDNSHDYSFLKEWGLVY